MFFSSGRRKTSRMSDMFLARKDSLMVIPLTCSLLVFGSKRGIVILEPSVLENSLGDQLTEQIKEIDLKKNCWKPKISILNRLSRKLEHGKQQLISKGKIWRAVSQNQQLWILSAWREKKLVCHNFVGSLSRYRGWAREWPRKKRWQLYGALKGFKICTY